MEFGARVLGLERGPLALGLLDPVFAKDAVASLEGRSNQRRGMGLADGDQRHLGGFTPGRPGRGGDPLVG